MPLFSLMKHEVYIHPIEIGSKDIDIMGHVNNVSYVVWMQDAAVAHSAANGWGWDRYRQLGAAFVARAHAIEYLTSAFEGDDIHIKTWVCEMKKVSSTRRYEFVNSRTAEVIAKASTRWAFIDVNTSRPTRIPAEIIDCFEIVDESR